ncbi:hypothetical protein [Nocardioides sediminis]|uniref:hypothetical protein n=1 Tax=Nocardioides sediminis TaxID=433648 RepID=UPI000D30C5E6|nr:hypothetical protein [Nocardioides sediminis]
MARRPIPAPRPLLHPLRTADSARSTVQLLPHHRMRVTIDHQPLAGITPAMLLWWFQHIGDSTTYGGKQIPGYLAWHPLDHIRWELARPASGGGVGEGARFRIVEAFDRRPEFYVDSTETVEKLDGAGIRLVRRLAGIQVFQLEHTWSACGQGTHYVSVLDLGARSPLLSPVNRYLRTRVFPERMARAWVVHNVEEVGVLEHLLPDVLRQRTDVDA